MEEVLQKVEDLSNQLVILQKYVSLKFGCDFKCFLQKEKESLQRRKRKHPLETATTSSGCFHKNERSGRKRSGRCGSGEEYSMSSADPLGDEDDCQVFLKAEPLDDRDQYQEDSEDLDLDNCLFPDHEGQGEKPLVSVTKVVHDPDYAPDRDSGDDSEDGRVKRLRRMRDSYEKKRPGETFEERKAIDRFSEVATETPDLRVFPGNRGAYIVTFEGHLYQFHKKLKDRLNFTCDRKTDNGNKEKCRGRVHLSFDYKRVVFRPGEEGIEQHSHPPCRGATDVRYGMWKLKTLVALQGGLENFGELYERVQGLLSPEGRELLPTQKGARAIISKERQRKAREMRKGQGQDQGLLPDMNMTMGMSLGNANNIVNIPEFSNSFNNR